APERTYWKYLSEERRSRRRPGPKWASQIRRYFFSGLLRRDDAVLVLAGQVKRACRRHHRELDRVVGIVVAGALMLRVGARARDRGSHRGLRAGADRAWREPHLAGVVPGPDRLLPLAVNRRHHHDGV